MSFENQRVPAPTNPLGEKVEGVWRRFFEYLKDKVGTPWKVDPIHGDLYPDGVGEAGELPGIGTLDKSPAFVAVGAQAPFSAEGYITGRSDADGGGLALVGYRGEAPKAAPEFNAPIEAYGNGFIITGGQLWLNVPTTVTEDRYLIAGESVASPDTGELYVPVSIGPQVIYALSEIATDTRDLDVNLVTQRVVTLTLANSYSVPAATTFTYGVQLDERSDSRSSTFTIEIFLNAESTPRITETVGMNASTRYHSEAFTLISVLSAGDQIHMDVSAVPGHQNSDPWVSGSIRESMLEVKQG